MKRLLLITMTLLVSALFMTGCEDIIEDKITEKLPVTTEKSKVPSAAQATAGDTEFIGEEKAEQIALEKAGLTADAVTFINIDLDRDNGIWKYDVEFRQGKTEYDAEINALDGSVIKWEMDAD